MFDSGTTPMNAALFGALIFNASSLFASQPVLAHEAKSGWRYPYACCSDRDCREISSTTVSEGPQGYVIKVTGEVLPYTDKRVKLSPDGLFHWCSVAGKSDSRTVCLFVPPRSF